VIVLRLETLPGQLHTGAADLYYVTQCRGEYTLRNHHLAPKTFATLEALAHTLGGMIAWDRWSPETQLQLDHLKLRGAF
jgi:hypothetical protein